MKVVGLMSGTSGDGVDAALIDISGAVPQLTVRCRSFLTLPYPPPLKRKLLQAAGSGSVDDVCHLNAALGEVFAAAALRVIARGGLSPGAVRLIGSHGHTLRHLPAPRREPGLGPIRSTLQIGSPAVIAERTGVTTIADFRQRDMAVGGQGAPLAPYAHHALLRHASRSRLIVNLGGIANVTYLPAGASLRSVRAFDTGPGNMVLDGLVRHYTRGRQAMDRDGRLAAAGAIDHRLLEKLLLHPFFRSRPPKSTGREAFGASFVARVVAEAGRRRLALSEVLATCSMLTARTVAGARRWLTGKVDEVLVGGGGALNRTLLRHLCGTFAPIPVRTFEEAGWQGKAFEAVAFALLAYESWHGRCTNIPQATGALRPVVLGSIIPGRRSGRPRPA